MKKYGAPRQIVTDGLCSYSAAMNEIGAADRQEVGGRLTRKTKCDHIFPSAAAPAGPCDHISPERRHRRRGCNHISFATGANPSARVRSRRRNVAQSVLPSVWPVRYPLKRVSGLLGSQGRGRWERLRFGLASRRPRSREPACSARATVFSATRRDVCREGLPQGDATLTFVQAPKTGNLFVSSPWP